MSDDHAVLHYRYEWGEGAEWWLLNDTLGLIPEYEEMLQAHHPLMNTFFYGGFAECYACAMEWVKCEIIQDLKVEASKLAGVAQPELGQLFLNAYLSLKETEEV